jgi:hypothetical protein
MIMPTPGGLYVHFEGTPTPKSCDVLLYTGCDLAHSLLSYLIRLTTAL